MDCKKVSAVLVFLAACLLIASEIHDFSAISEPLTIMLCHVVQTKATPVINSQASPQNGSSCLYATVLDSQLEVFPQLACHREAVLQVASVLGDCIATSQAWYELE